MRSFLSLWRLSFFWRQFRSRQIGRKWFIGAVITGLLLATGVTGVAPLPVAQAFSCGGVPDPPADRSFTINNEADGITAMNNARAMEGLGALALPGNFYSLSPEDRILTLFNLERADRGIATFAAGNDPVLARVAENHSQVLVEFSLFAHTTAVDADISTRIFQAPGISGHVTTAGEIIASAPYSTFHVFLWLYADAGSAWGHRHAIFGCYSHVGIGYVTGGMYGAISTADFINSNGTYVPQSPDTTLPSLTYNSSSYNGGTSALTVTATATDGGSGLRHVAFFIDGNFGGSVVPAGTSGPGDTFTYVFNGVSVGNHNLVILAFDKNNNYSRVNQVINTTPPPAAPTALSATTISNSQINLSWTDNSGTNETGFEVERSLDGSTWTLVATTGQNVNSYSNTGLLGATPYSYRVRAINAGGGSAYTNVSSATTRPNAPGNLTLSVVSNSEIDLSWGDVAGETGYVVERSPDGSTGWAQVATPGPNVVTFNNTLLTSATTYYYRVYATGAGGNSAYSNIANATTLPAAPAAPTLGGITSTNIGVTFTGVSGVVSGYYIQRSLNGSTNWMTIATFASPTTYNDNGVGPATTYYYRVIAYNSGGLSVPSPSSLGATTLTATYTVGTFSQLSTALGSATSGQSIAFSVSTIIVTGTLNVPSGVTIFGGVCGTVGITLDGGGAFNNGPVLNGATLINVKIQGFLTKQVTITPATHNAFQCVKIDEN